MIIDVIDMEDPAVGRDVSSRLAGLGTTMVMLYGMCNGVGQMVGDVTRAAGRLNSINALRIWSHGGPGLQNVSAGAAVANVHWAGISNSNINSLEPTLKSLRPYFAPRARVELRGCDVGLGNAGQRLLIKLAEIFGVEVHAGIVTQYGIGWIGPVHVALPNGTMYCSTGVSATAAGFGG